MGSGATVTYLEQLLFNLSSLVSNFYENGNDFLTTFCVCACIYWMCTDTVYIYVLPQ